MPAGREVPAEVDRVDAGDFLAGLGLTADDFFAASGFPADARFAAVRLPASSMVPAVADFRSALARSRRR